MINKKEQLVLFVMPRSSGSWIGSEALWITVAGWAAAAERKYGRAVVITNDRTATPQQTLSYPIIDKRSSKGFKNKSLTSRLPTTVITFVKDCLLWRASKKNSDNNHNIPGTSDGVKLVWEQHDLFPGRGFKLAKKHNVPFVIYVHAPQVWEASKWGVSRPGWGKLLEKLEAKSLKRADMVACVSNQVAEKLIEMGIPQDKILISPMAVDAHLFDNNTSNDVEETYDLRNKYVIGWTGSFRSFHGLDILLKVFEKVHRTIKNSRLMLVGDGAEKEEMMRMAEDLGISDAVIFTGRKSFTEIPSYVNAFDLAIVSARKAEDFHYSPLKLREYLGAGKTTLAPNAGEIPKKFQDDIHLKLYNVGDVEGTAQNIIELFNDKSKSDRLASMGKDHILKTGTWDVELNKLMIKLN